LNATELQKLKALAQAATPGPWVLSKYCSVMANASNLEIVPSDANEPDDNRYIAAANPSAILELIELAEKGIADRPVGEAGSIDTPEFLKLMVEWSDTEPGEGAAKIFDSIVAHIDAQIAKAREVSTEIHIHQIAGISTAACGYWKEGDSIQEETFVRLGDAPALLSSTAQPLQQEGGKETPIGGWPNDFHALIKNAEASSYQQGRENGIDEAANAVASTNTLGMTAWDAISTICENVRALVSQPPGKLQQASIAQAETAKVASDKVTTCLAAECTAEVVRDKAACWCATCRPVTPFGDPADNRMVLCPTCGNKRCPHAHDHRNACTNSNELGQIGSHYPAASATDAEHVGSGALKQFLKAAEDAGITHLNFKRATPEGGQDERANWTTKQWYEHVGAWETDEGFISFGSVMALRAMLLQFQKMTIDQSAASQQVVEHDREGWTWLQCPHCGSGIKTIPKDTASQLAAEHDKRPLFDRKLAELRQRGYEVIGRVLHKDGEYALFDSSCRWLTKPQYQRLMHEQDGSLFATPKAAELVAYLDLEKLAKSGMAYATDFRLNTRQTELYRAAPLQQVDTSGLPG
jgi:Zn finger protein HypA/HybF involved in hydrogenase expression